MKRLGLFIVLLTGLILALQPLTAQDEKKDADKAAKKDDAKDPEKKDEEKKKTDKEKKLIEKMPVFGSKIVTKIMSANGASNREFTIELQEVDPKKVYDLGVWKAQQSQALAQQQYQMSVAKDPKGRFTAMQNYQK